ncbi:MAG: hypothetical protein C0490_14370 [Marivirga sp.]|nr:hypothetical protein [Marivirga sp.]
MKNAEFYKKIQIPKKDKFQTFILSRYWLLYFFGNLLVIFLAPMLGRFNRVVLLSGQSYWRIWGVSALIVLALNIIFAWFIDVRPYFDKRKGFYWRGCFTVISKTSSSGYKYLILKPGSSHRIKVRSEFYHSVRHGDRIFLERSYLGDIRKIRKISGFLERIKKNSRIA